MAATASQIDEDQITRDTYEGLHEDVDEIRLYTYEPTGETLPSVTTVLKTRDEDKSNLHNWQDRNDGEGDNPYHEHLFWYSRHRGTLCHWHALKKLDPDLEWSEDEQQSEDEIIAQEAEEVVNDSAREVLYSVEKYNHAVESWGEFYNKHSPYKQHDYYASELERRLERDIDFFVSTFDEICEKIGITEDNIIAVEEFLFNLEDGYAGQVDMVYRCPKTDDVVVADLKTSSGCYTKHKTQGAAYGNSVEELLGLKPDRLEVWRIHPDSGQWAVHCHDETLPIHTSKWWNKDYDDLLDDFLELANNFEYNDE